MSDHDLVLTAERAQKRSSHPVTKESFLRRTSPPAFLYALARLKSRVPSLANLNLNGNHHGEFIEKGSGHGLMD